MIIDLTQEQRERLEAAVIAYYTEVAAIAEELAKDCKTKEDLEIVTAVLKVAMDQANKKVEENSTRK